MHNDSSVWRRARSTIRIVKRGAWCLTPGHGVAVPVTSVAFQKPCRIKGPENGPHNGPVSRCVTKLNNSARANAYALQHIPALNTKTTT